MLKELNQIVLMGIEIENEQRVFARQLRGFLQELKSQIEILKTKTSLVDETNRQALEFLEKNHSQLLDFNRMVNKINQRIVSLELQKKHSVVSERENIQAHINLVMQTLEDDPFCLTTLSTYNQHYQISRISLSRVLPGLFFDPIQDFVKRGAKYVGTLEKLIQKKKRYFQKYQEFIYKWSGEDKKGSRGRILEKKKKECNDKLETCAIQLPALEARINTHISLIDNRINELNWQPNAQERGRVKELTVLKTQLEERVSFQKLLQESKKWNFARDRSRTYMTIGDPYVLVPPDSFSLLYSQALQLAEARSELLADKNGMEHVQELIAQMEEAFIFGDLITEKKDIEGELGLELRSIVAPRQG
jgi:hypothetical protein